VLVYWGFVSLSYPLSLGQDQRSVSQLPAVNVLYWFVVFQFCNILYLWMLLTGSGDELCGPLSALFQAAAYHPPTVSPSAFPVFVYWKFPWSSAPCFSPLLWYAQSTLLPLLQVPFQLVIYYSDFFLFCMAGVSLPRGLCWFIPGWLWEYHMLLICSPVGLPDVSQADLELVSGSMGALLFSQCNVAWRSFVCARGSGYQSFDSSWCFLSAKGGSSVSAKFLIYRA
jgi:hypothetical protein